ncbi:MAG: ATPase [Methylocystaceae bacterium]|nr:MAG: ATPase [Methylocystaceae bacterium]
MADELPPEWRVVGDDAPHDEPESVRRDFDERIHVEQPATPLKFKSAAAFVREYVPLAYTIEPLLRSSSLYTLTAKTGAGKTAFLIVAALAVASGRADVLGREVHKGRVAYIACENPDDIRMRLMIAAYVLNVDLREIGDKILILDRREKPEAIHTTLAQLAEHEQFALVIVDTLAALFDGDDINNAVQGGNFMRRLRPLTQIAGKPSVIVAAHPVKNAAEDNLVPCGSGAILNEVDGNLTLWKKPDSGLVSLHWQGKLRGLEFEPATFRFEITGCPEILDAKGREVLLPTLRPTSGEVADDREQAEVDTDRKLLQAMLDEPKGTLATWAITIGLKGKSGVGFKLNKLAKEKLVEKILGRWRVTAKGQKALEDACR